MPPNGLRVIVLLDAPQRDFDGSELSSKRH
jgi:hypothetical protein